MQGQRSNNCIMHETCIAPARTGVLTYCGFMLLGGREKVMGWTKGFALIVSRSNENDASYTVPS
jgi:hypothetical protein